MPSLSPRRNHWAHMPVLPADIAFAPASGARLPGSYVSRLSLRSLSLRPGCLLTVLATALSTGSRQSITLPPAVRATRLRALVMVGLLSYRMYLPCLDARGWHSKSRRETGSTTWARNCHGDGGVKSPASPYGAKRFTGQPSHRSPSGSPAVGSRP